MPEHDSEYYERQFADRSLREFADRVGVPLDDPRWETARRAVQSNVLLPLVRVSHSDGVTCDECAEARANPHSFQSHVLTDADGDPATCGFELPSGALCGGLADDPEHVAEEYDPRHPEPRCKECGELLGDDDRAEVFLTGRVESAWSYGPFLVHADPCYTGNRDKYDLA